jgi:aspartyl-tRNA(Asn)/glutamyl-tRNA(Gln) amidotransferase subunit A
MEGIVPLSKSLDHAGPMARSVSDAALLLDPILVRAEHKLPLHSASGLSEKSGKFTLGLPREFFFELVSNDVLKIFHVALRSLCRLGARISDVSLPLLKETENAGNQIAWSEATHYHRTEGWFPARAADYGEDVRSRLELGTQVSAMVYLEALELRDKFIQQLHLAMADAGADALIVPTTPITAPLINEEKSRLNEKDHPTRQLLLRLNRPANLAGIPAISIPCGFTPAGLPVGLQLIGAVTCEHLLLSIAHKFERAHPQTLRPLL